MFLGSDYADSGVQVHVLQGSGHSSGSGPAAGAELLTGPSLRTRRTAIRPVNQGGDGTFRCT